MSNEQPAPAVAGRLDQPVRPGVDWHAHGMSWALCEAMTEAAGQEWTTGDIASAFAAGAAAAEKQHAAEIEVREELARYSREDGRREWSSVGAWLYAGDRICVLRMATGETTGYSGCTGPNVL